MLPWFHPGSAPFVPQDVQEKGRAFMAGNVARTCTLQSRCRLARGTISLLVGALAAAGASSLSTPGERHVSRVSRVYKAAQGRPWAGHSFPGRSPEHSFPGCPVPGRPQGSPLQYTNYSSMLLVLMISVIRAMKLSSGVAPRFSLVRRRTETALSAASLSPTTSM